MYLGCERKTGPGCSSRWCPVRHAQPAFESVNGLASSKSSIKITSAEQWHTTESGTSSIRTRRGSTGAFDARDHHAVGRYFYVRLGSRFTADAGRSGAWSGLPLLTRPVQGPVRGRGCLVVRVELALRGFGARKLIRVGRLDRAGFDEGLSCHDQFSFHST